MDKQIKKKKASVGAFLVSLAVSAAMFALPVSTGGLENISYFVCWVYAWLFSVTLFVTMFVSPLDELPVASMPRRFIDQAARYAAIAWLAWHGMVLLPILFLLTYLFAYAILHHTRQEYDKQQSA